MGSLFSPIMAALLFQDLEEEAISRLPILLSFYFEYVDDTCYLFFLFILLYIGHIFNFFHHRLQLMIKIGKNNVINFLDVIIMIKEDFF